MLADLINARGAGCLPVVLQAEATECGLACLAMVAAFHGNPIDLNTLRRRYPGSMKGLTLKALIRIAGQMGLSARPLRIEPVHLRQLRLPAILHWDMDHYVVLKRAGGRGEGTVVVHDPATGQKTLSLAEASKHVTGIALELEPSEGFARRDERARLPLSSFWSRSRGMTGSLAQVFVLSVLLEILVVVSPFYMQLAVDEVVVKGDGDLLLALALGFGLLAAVSVAATALRSYILLLVQATLGLRFGADLFRHLLRLPLSFFEKRHVGDVMSRFGSAEPIRNLFAEGLIGATIDGVMAVATLAAMAFFYNGKLALVVLGAVLAYAVLRVVLYGPFRRRSEAVIQATAQERTSFIETVRAVQGVKLFNAEAEREARWTNRYADVANAEIRRGRLSIAFKTASGALFGLENIVTVYLAIGLVLDGSLTVGMVFAFVSYKRHFVEKASTLIEKALEFRALELHLERIGDIALTPAEPGHDQTQSYVRPITGRIELRDVCFRYAETEPFVLAGVNLTVEPGEFVTIAGPSGGGKTTLMKLMLGLLEPTSGEVLVDGVPLAVVGARTFRDQVGAVMQDDHLLSGTIADNICFFGQGFDPDWMVRCAQMASVHDEVMAMPMAYNTLIGDMGSSLSAGQRQRILLARALYRRPRILFIDEGTAHLDVATERRIAETLRGLDVTRISVAHRPETIRSADRVVTIGAGSPVE